MHPVVLQQLAAEHVREMIADADDVRPHLTNHALSEGCR
jgi:hypothetical protein